MLYIAISLTLLTLMAGALLLWKTKTDSMGNLARWVSYVVIILSIGMLVCQLSRAGRMMMHAGEMREMREHAMMEGNMMHDHGKRMDCCMHDGRMDCCMKEHGGMSAAKDKCCDMDKEKEDDGKDSLK